MNRPLTPTEANPFRYGWRYVQRLKPNGTEEWDQVPLTLEDVLHPREGDVIPTNTIHDDDRTYLKTVARSRVRRRRGWLVLSDCLIDWGVRGVRAMSPDLAPIPNVADPKRQRGTFYVALEGTAPILVVEIVSPDTRKNDVVEKVRLYHRVKVPLYVIVDQKHEGGPRELLAYRYTRRRYVPVPLDEQGRLRLDALGIDLGLRDNRLVCYDARTGEEIPDPAKVEEARRAAERRARAAEARVRELEEELQRLRGQPPG